jgi:hypothetical protein
MLPEDLPFRVIRINSQDEVLARAANLVIGRPHLRPGAGSFRSTSFISGTAHRSLRGASPRPQSCLDLGMKVVSK